MDNIGFKNSFYFASYSFRYHHTDHLSGVQGNYIVVMRSGKGCFIQNGEKTEVSAGDYLFIPDHCCYESYFVGNPCCFDTFVFSYYPGSELNMPMQILSPNEKVKELYKKISTRINGESVGFLYQMLNILIPTMHSSSYTKHELTVKKAIGFMKQNTVYSISDVAKFCDVSESLFYDIFKKTTGTTPTQKKHEIQIEKALNLLLTTDMTVQAISDATGFCSTAYFRKILSEQTGKSPKAIRNERRYI